MSEEYRNIKAQFSAQNKFSQIYTPIFWNTLCDHIRIKTYFFSRMECLLSLITNHIMDNIDETSKHRTLQKKYFCFYDLVFFFDIYQLKIKRGI